MLATAVDGLILPRVMSRLLGGDASFTTNFGQIGISNTVSPLPPGPGAAGGVCSVLITSPWTGRRMSNRHHPMG